ncbi:hypothetical protein B0T26DRAFT_769994, partial [Lasiosphaeria miniovina]
WIAFGRIRPLAPRSDLVFYLRFKIGSEVDVQRVCGWIDGCATACEMESADTTGSCRRPAKHGRFVAPRPGSGSFSDTFPGIRVLRLIDINKSSLVQVDQVPRHAAPSYIWGAIQDDQDDVEVGINVMGRIYEFAWFTIVAACGRDANSGLPGVRSSTQDEKSILKEVKPGIQLGIYTGSASPIKNSVHETRAWTYGNNVYPWLNI